MAGKNKGFSLQSLIQKIPTALEQLGGRTESITQLKKSVGYNSPHNVTSGTFVLALKALKRRKVLDFHYKAKPGCRPNCDFYADLHGSLPASMKTFDVSPVELDDKLESGLRLIAAAMKENVRKEMDEEYEARIQELKKSHERELEALKIEIESKNDEGRFLRKIFGVK